jgi:hypothetical protein
MQAEVIPVSPDWSALDSFFWAFAAFVFVAGLYAYALARGTLTSITRRTSTDPPRSSPRAPLVYLDTAWSFSDSWVSNITVIGGLLTGIIGSTSVVKTLGDQAEGSRALATVGAAVAVAFIAAGPIVLLSTKRGGYFSVGGLLLASSIVLAGAAGELYVVADAATRLTLGGFEGWLPWVLLGTAFGLLLLLCGDHGAGDGRARPDEAADRSHIRHDQRRQDGRRGARCSGVRGHDQDKRRRSGVDPCWDEPRCRSVAPAQKRAALRPPTGSYGSQSMSKRKFLTIAVAAVAAAGAWGGIAMAASGNGASKSPSVPKSNMAGHHCPHMGDGASTYSTANL